MKILKFPLPDFINKLSIPFGGKIVSVQQQDGIPTMWVLFEQYDEGVTEQRRFSLYGTGQTIPPSSEYLDTVQCGSYVWHVFEE